MEEGSLATEEVMSRLPTGLDEVTKAYAITLAGRREMDFDELNKCLRHRGLGSTRYGILAEPIRVASDGTIPVPDAPGLGIELDEEKLAHYGEKYFEITSRGIAIKTVREKGFLTALRLARKRRR